MVMALCTKRHQALVPVRSNVLSRTLRHRNHNHLRHSLSLRTPSRYRLPILLPCLCTSLLEVHDPFNSSSSWLEPGYVASAVFLCLIFVFVHSHWYHFGKSQAPQSRRPIDIETFDSDSLVRQRRRLSRTWLSNPRRSKRRLNNNRKLLNPRSRSWKLTIGKRLPTQNWPHQGPRTSMTKTPGAKASIWRRDQPFAAVLVTNLDIKSLIVRDEAPMPTHTSSSSIYVTTAKPSSTSLI